MSTTGRRRETVAAAAAYAVLTIVFTWPIARGLARDVPGDFGDPLLNSWILAWDATHIFSGWRLWWNANIFHPHPLALAYSEHLAAAAIQILPIYRLTMNPLVCYNLLFCSTFVLSGLGMFLFVRELTNDRAAAFVGGLAYAFAPYRVASIPHLQVLSSAWMPYVFLGFRRYFSTRRLLPLALGACAWLAQNLSCGYYLLFFAPVMALYLTWEIATRELWRDRRALLTIAVTCAAVAAATLPFLLPYVELRRLGGVPRSLAETQRFSADVYAYLTADPNLRVWGSIARAWPKAEGSLFPGLTVFVLAAWAALRAASDVQGSSPTRDDDARSPRARLAIATVVIGALGIVLALLLGFSVRLPGLKITSLPRALIVAAIACAVLLVLSRAARQRLTAWLRAPAGFFTVLTLFAIVMSFGPQIRARDRVVLDPNLYALFYRFVPGFDGLRVPARFGMIVALGLSILAARALARTDRTPRTSRTWRTLRTLIPVLILLESFSAPIPINQRSADYARPDLAPLPSLSLEPPPVYEFVGSLPLDSAIVELPLGEPAFDVRYMFYSTGHWRRLVNGYTGGLPDDYALLDRMLQDLFTQPGRAWTTLREARATHAIVHESFYANGRGALVSEWLRANGAREIATYGTDRMFSLP